MNQQTLDDMFTDTAVPGLDDPNMPHQTKRTIVGILRQSHRLAEHLVDETGGFDDSNPQIDLAVESVREGALHAIEVVLSR